MLLTEYLSGLANVIDEYSRTGLISLSKARRFAHIPLGASGHKHLPDGKLVAAEPPSLKDMFSEIMDSLL